LKVFGSSLTIFQAYTKQTVFKDKIIKDEDVVEETKKVYRAVTVSDSWIQNFRVRHALVCRAITTKCDKIVEEIRASLTKYFIELHNIIDTHTPACVYNIGYSCNCLRRSALTLSSLHIQG